MLRISPVEVRRGPQRSDSRRLRSGEAHWRRRKEGRKEGGREEGRKEGGREGGREAGREEGRKEAGGQLT